MQNVPKKRKYTRKTKKQDKNEIKKIEENYIHYTKTNGYKMNKDYLNKFGNEQKFFDFQSQQVTIQNAYQNSPLQVTNVMKKGTGVYQRLGDCILITKIKYRFRILRANSPGVSQSTEFRFGLVYDGMTNGQIPTSQQVFLGTDYNGLGLKGANVFQNQVLNDRFKILCSHYYVSPQYVKGENEYTGTPMASFNSFVEGEIDCELPMKFLSGVDTGSVGDIVLGSIAYFVLCPAQNALGDWNSFCDIRFQFKDL